MRPEDLARPALEAARRALADLEDDQVPSSLRRVAASSARRLPPPQATLVLRELENGDWLRELAKEHLGEEPASGDPAREWSWVFVHRPDGWEQRLEVVARAAGDRAEEAEGQSLQSENRRLRARVERLERLLAGARAQAAERSGPDTGLVERLQESNKVIRASAEKREREAAALAAELEEAQEDLYRADRRIAELKRRLEAKSRPPPAGTDAAGPQRAARTFGGGHPVQLARFLDDLQRSLEQARHRPPDRVPSDRPGVTRLSLPPGIRPDGPGAVEWLLAIEDPATVLIDGYNVAFQLGGVPDGALRNRVENLSARIARLADGPITVIVFWDSSLEAAGDTPRRRTSGIEIRFVPSADDAIVEAAAGATNPIVVTGDRELRDRAARHGAIGLWSEAVIAWR